MYGLIFSALLVLFGCSKNSLPPCYRHGPSTIPLFAGPLASSIFLSLAQSSIPSVSASGGNANPKNHYEVLQIPQTATLQDIKKAYRKLAVKHHPDRNPGNEEEATILFREISEAYEVLSDESSRKEYDRFLKGGGGTTGFGWSDSDFASRRRQRPHRDPFAQFNDLFKNDPFFAEAFKSMDDLFDQTFANSGGGRGRDYRSKNEPEDKQVESKGFWGRLADWLPSVNIEVTTSSSSNGGTSYSTTSRSYGSGRKTRNHQRRTSSSTSYSSSSSSSTYTSRSTRTTIENGQRVMIQSLEKDGNKIEEKYIGDRLVERTINGVKDDIGRISRGREEF